MSKMNPGLCLPTTLALTFTGRARDAPLGVARRLPNSPGSGPSVDVVIGDAASVERVFATRAQHPARIAVVVGGGSVDGATCLVRSPDHRDAARAARLLLSLTSPRSGRVAYLDGDDLRAAVVGGGNTGFVIRHHAPTMAEAMQALHASTGARRLKSACIVFDIDDTMTCLTQVDAALEALFENDATLVCVLRPPRCRGALTGFTLFAST